MGGLAAGMVLFIVSVGLSVTMGLMGFVNLAHGAFAMLGPHLANFALDGNLPRGNGENGEGGTRVAVERTPRAAGSPIGVIQLARIQRIRNRVLAQHPIR